MAKKKTKAKKLSFRQRLRNDATLQLGAIKRKVEEVTEAELVAADTGINKYDLFRLLSAGMTKTLEERLITELTNEKEDALERLYNTQLGLLPEEDDADKKED